MPNLIDENWQPFSLIDNVELEGLFFNNDLLNTGYNIDVLNKVIFQQFSNNIHSSIVNSDPDVNFYSEISEVCDQCEYFFIDSLKKINKNSDRFSICSLNINSISKNFETFTDLFLGKSGVDFDVIGLCESKLTDEIEQIFNINHYSMYTLNNKRNKGGLLMYINKKFNDIVVRNDLSKIDENIEIMVTDIAYSKENILCVLIYHRPSSNKQVFLNDIENLVEKISRENKKIYIFGDFNINLINSNNVYSKQLIEIMQSNNFFNLIVKPTRVTSTSTTVIDHIWTNDAGNCRYNGIIFETISDHFPNFATFENLKHHVDEIKYFDKTFRDFCNSNKINFKDDLDNLTWESVFLSDDPNSSYDNFIEIFLTLFDDNFPLITKKVKLKDFQKPYITPEIKILIDNKKKLQHKFSKKPLTFGDEYRQARNLATAAVRKAKSKYYRDKLEDCAGDARSTWKIINNVLKRNHSESLPNNVKFVKNDNNNFRNCINVDGNSNENIYITDPIDISNNFNDYFVNVGKSLSERLPHTDTPPSSFYGPRIDRELRLESTNESEVVEMVGSLRDGAVGYDEISASLIKYVIHQIKTPLAYIFNLAIKSGTFPDKLKITKVIPIHKANSKANFNNYRPISLLPIISKILEKIIYKRLNDFVRINNIISPFQHGFVELKSTTSATICLTDYTLKAFDDEKFSIGIFLDLSKAFDSVNHDILLHKLEHLGIRNTAFRLIESYLSNRKQYVKFNNSNSELKTLTHSVPQGSILGPL